MTDNGKIVQAAQYLVQRYAVITGSIIPPKPLSAGDTATIAIGGLGEAHVTVLEAYTGAGLRGTLGRGMGL